VTAVSDFRIHPLCARGVRRLSGAPGDGMDGWWGTNARRDGDITFVQTGYAGMAT
jgi:pyruvate dehydrogenase (quinone)